MAWKLINGKYVEVDESGLVKNDGKSITKKTSSGGSFKHHGIQSGTGGDLDKMILHFLNTGEVQSAEQAGKKGLSKSKYDNIYADFIDVMDANGVDPKEYSNTIKEEQGISGKNKTLQENFFDMDMDGTVANDLYNTFKQANQDQYESGRIESQYMEKDLNKMVGMERQNLIDSIREDRKKMLKSGLSQSAIANREIQGMLQGQSIASEMGQGFLGERRNLEQMGAGIDSMSRVQAYESMGGGLGNAYGGIAAAGAGDMYDSILKYSRGGSKIQNYYDDMVKKQQGKF